MLRTAILETSLASHFESYLCESGIPYTRYKDVFTLGDGVFIMDTFLVAERSDKGFFDRVAVRFQSDLPNGYASLYTKVQKEFISFDSSFLHFVKL